MNIGFMYGTKCYPPGLGGSVHGYQLAKGLAERGHRLYTWYYGSGGHPDVVDLRRREVLKFLRRIDVLYVRGGFGGGGSWRWFRRFKFGSCPVVMELNGLPRELLFEGGSEQDVRRAVDRMRRRAGEVSAGIGVSESIRAFMEDEIGIARTWCIPNGSDPELFRPSGKDRNARGPLEVVWMGSLKFGWHDIDTLLAAADLLEAKGVDVRFTIYGDREGLPKKLAANVRCPGRVPYEQLGQCLGRADVGVFLYSALNGEIVDASSPLKFFDYMACGLAVVTRDAGQVAQIIRDRGVGLTTSGTAEDLADKITHLSEDRNLCAELGVNGRRAVEEYYNWDRVASGTERVLRQVRKC